MMDNEKRIAELTKYIERAKRILVLSSPTLDKINNEEDYRKHLLESFGEIGRLGQKNIETLEEHFLPLLDPDRELTEDDVELLRTFSSMLIDTTSMENIDLPLIYLQAERLMEAAEKSGSIRDKVLAADNMVIASYMMINISIRLYPVFNDCFRYRDVDLEAAQSLLEYLDYDKFLTLPDEECREKVLVNSRYIRSLFVWDDGKYAREEANRKDLDMLKRALALADDPFYREHASEYDWDIHVFRTLQYLSDFTEDNNKHQFNQEQLEEIYRYTLQLVEFLKAHPELESGCPPIEQQFYMARNSYLSGHSNIDDYRKALLKIMEEGDRHDFTARGMFVSLTAPLEYIFSLDKDNITSEQEDVIRRIYIDIASYAYHMPKTGVLSFMLTFISDLLKNFIEVPGGMPFRSMCRRLIAAMHPPTYVHSLNVAEIAKFLGNELLEKRPELFSGIYGAEDAELVQSMQDEIEEFIYNSALMHDVGKIFIIETILTYGRRLVMTEKDFIHTHTRVGASLLQRYPQTSEYADIALAHHRWYDDSQGYPEDFRIAGSKYKTIISIVQAADCIDAATDRIGRSYKGGLSLPAVIDELRQGSGTQYAPFVVELLDDTAVTDRLHKILTEGRDENYRLTYHLLEKL